MDSETMKVRDAVVILKSKGWTVIPPDVEDTDYPFSAAWDAYQKKVGDKVKLKAKWDRLSKKTKAAIMEHIPRYVANTPDKKYRKNFSTYLNNKSWEDEIIPYSSQNGRQHITKEEAISDIFNQHNRMSKASESPAMDGKIPDPF